MPRIVFNDDGLQVVSDDDESSEWTPFYSAEFEVDTNRNYQPASDIREYDTDFELSAEGIEEQILERQNRANWAKHGKDPVGDFRAGKRLNELEMEFNTIKSWFFHEATDELSDERIAEIADGEAYDDTSGFNAVRHAVLERASDEINHQIERGYDGVEAFNNVSEDWPHKARAYLAGYETNYTDHGSEQYREDVEDFAMTESLEDYEAVQSSLSMFTDGSPFTDDNYTNEEATTALLVAVHEDDTMVAQQAISEVNDHETFRDWLRKLGDTQAALNAQEYDDVVPQTLLPDLAPPEEWEELDPTDIEKGRCRNCSTEYYHVRGRQTGAPAWLSESGTIDTVHKIGIGNEVLDVNSPSNETGCLCDSCRDDIMDNSNTASYITPEGDSIQVHWNYGFGIDTGLTEDSPTVPLAEVPEEYRTRLLEVTNGRPSDHIEIRPRTEVGDQTLQRQAMAELADGERDIERDMDSGFFVVISEHFDGIRTHIYVPNDDPEAAMEAKHTMEAATNV